MRLSDLLSQQSLSVMKESEKESKEILANFKLCPSCQAKLDAASLEQDKFRNKHKDTINDFFANSVLSLGKHGTEKAEKNNIVLDNEIINMIFKSDVVELQRGKGIGEFKMILLNQLNGKPLHFIILFVPNRTPSLVNVYYPKEEMGFKWSDNGSKRVYLNSFRSCCEHPFDKKEWHNKEHHGRNHRLYDYQVNK